MPEQLNGKRQILNWHELENWKKEFICLVADGQKIALGDDGAFAETVDYNAVQRLAHELAENSVSVRFHNPPPDLS
jgi:hypothetical protein